MGYLHLLARIAIDEVQHLLAGRAIRVRGNHFLFVLPYGILGPVEQFRHFRE